MILLSFTLTYNFRLPTRPPKLDAVVHHCRAVRGPFVASNRLMPYFRTPLYFCRVERAI